MIELTFFENGTRFGYGVHMLRDNQQNIVLDEIPEDIQDVLSKIIIYFGRYKTEAEKAQIEALKRMELNDEDKLQLKAIYPEWNKYETYSEGDEVQYAGHIFRFKADEAPKMMSTRMKMTERTIMSKPVPPITAPKSWKIVGEELPVFNWIDKTPFEQGFMEGTRVRFPDGRILVSKINYNLYHPDDRPDTWEEANDGN